MNRSIEETIEFIADITGPIGPETFCGYGSKIQNELSKDPLARESIILWWVNDSDKEALIANLLLISKNKELLVESVLEKKVNAKDWEFTLTELIYETINSNAEMKLRSLKTLSEYSHVMTQ